MVSTFYASASIDPNGAAGRCERMALLTMNKPGRYLFELQAEPSIFYGGNDSYRCKLTRLP